MNIFVMLIVAIGFIGLLMLVFGLAYAGGRDDQLREEEAKAELKRLSKYLGK